MPGVEVTIVIPAYNAEKVICLTLSSIEKMRFSEPYEVIVVDDGSSDRTKEIIGKFNVKIINQQRKGPGAARNAGIMLAKGSFVYFLDSDCEIGKHTLQMLYNYIKKDKRIGAVGGSIELPKTGQNLLARADHYCSWYHHNPLQKSGNVRSTPTANLLVRKEIFEKTGYFKTNVTSGEDVDFGINVRNAGYGFHALNSALVYHYNRTNFKSFKRHALKWGYNSPLVRSKNKDAKYHYLFPENVFIAAIYFLPLMLAHAAYIQFTWLKLGNYRSLAYSPFIFLHSLFYQAGVIIGTIDLKKKDEAKANIY